MSRRNELRVQLSLSRVDIRIASAPAVQCCCWAVDGSRLDGPSLLISVCGWEAGAAVRGRQVPYLGRDHLPWC